MTFIDFLMYVNLLTFLAYIPIVCYLDIRYREVHPYVWIPMVIICSPIALYMYSTLYWYQWYTAVISIVMALIFFTAMYFKVLEGADFLFLLLISVFWVLSPIGGVHGLMQPLFYIYFAFASALTAIYILGYNIVKGNRFDVISMMSKYPRGVPYMVTISLAFVLSVVMG